MKNECYCHEVTFKPCAFCELNKTSWGLIPSNERVVLLAYKRVLLKDLPVPRKMILEVNNIISKYEDFSVAEIP